MWRGRDLHKHIINAIEADGTLKTKMPKIPSPPTATNVEIIDNAILHADNLPRPKWRDKDGVVWGTAGHQSRPYIYYSNDNWETVERAINAPEIGGSAQGVRNNGLIISNTGRIIIGNANGDVFVSNEEKTEWIN